MGHFAAKTSASSKVWTHSKDFLKFCTLKGAKRHVKFMLRVCKKDLVEGEWVIVGPKMLSPQNSRSALELFSVIVAVNSVHYLLNKSKTGGSFF